MSFGYFLSCFLQVFGEFGEFWSDLASLSLFMANASFWRVSVRVFLNVCPFLQVLASLVEFFCAFLASSWLIIGEFLARFGKFLRVLDEFLVRS